MDPTLHSGRSADDVMDAIIEAVRPVDGTLDTEASREAIKDALSEVLSRFPEADLQNLRDSERELAIEQFVASDVFHRFDLDLGRLIRKNSPNATVALGRLKEAREYIREAVAASFRRLREAGQRLAAHRVSAIVQAALRETFSVFEGYAT